MNKPKISFVVAISENRVIGRDNKLPWHISEDLQRFKNLTNGHAIIMGRKTFESLGRPLPNRLNIIVSRNFSYDHPDVKVFSSLEEAIEFAKNFEMNNQNNEVFIIGGGQIFEQAIKIADKLYLTIVHTNIDGDIYFPEYSEFTKEVFRKDSSNEEYKYTFLDLER